MATLTVGTNKAYQTIRAAVAASASGDTVTIDAGTYTNDFVGIYHDLTVQSAGGNVHLVATTSPPNGKAIVDVGGPGVTVTLSGLEISGAVVPDGNGAGIRYEGGTLVMRNMDIHDNEDGILANGDAAGSITIANSNFHGNGSGTGLTHNIYVGAIASLTVQDSRSTGAIVGHQIKSRAAVTTITGNVIGDGASGTASYEIDIPNGGVAVITGNIIEKGPGAQNPIAVSFGEEGNLYANSSLTVTGNTIVNDLPGRTTLGIVNRATAAAVITDNAIYGWTSLSSGPAAASANTTLSTPPALAALSAGVAGDTVAYTDVTTSRSGVLSLDAVPVGAPSYLAGQFIWSSPDSVAIATATPNVFLKGGTGADALQAGSGRNVLDGGGGSNFLVGGSGNDTFFADARGGVEVWSTVVNFGAGDAATLWGFVAGASTYAWDADVSGAVGYKGATLRATIDGRPNGASVTFAGLTVDQGRAMQISTGTAGGVAYLLATV